jgi:hypothetical protein
MPSNRLINRLPIPLVPSACCLQVKALEHVVTAAFQQVVGGMQEDLAEVKGRLEGLRGERDRWVGARQSCGPRCLPTVHVAAAAPLSCCCMAGQLQLNLLQHVHLRIQAGLPAGRDAAAAGRCRG